MRIGQLMKFLAVSDRKCRETKLHSHIFNNNSISNKNNFKLINKLCIKIGCQNYFRILKKLFNLLTGA